MKTILCFAVAILVTGSVHHIEAQTLIVPTDFKSIAEAVDNAVNGDTIILSPGIYHERGVEISKALTISSEWILTGEEALIESTVIDPGDTILFSVTSNDVEISGLSIINGDHTLDINARVSVKYNHLMNNKDAVSMESGGGGYVGFNLIENDRDDGIDLDISKSGTDIIVENNTIVNSNDDGIEIRLFSKPEQNIHYEIRHNIITGSKRAGIQLISYDEYTGKVFHIHHNIFRNCKTGLGCMEGSNTTEDLSGASKMDERVYFYNNTMLDNEMGATGGSNIFAINNIIAGNTLGGFKRFGENSVVANNLFYNNMENNLMENSESIGKYGNIFDEDPMLDDITQKPEQGSPCVDSGLDTLIVDGIPVIELAPEAYAGSAPDMGALESNDKHNSGTIRSELFVDAGQDLVIKDPVSLTQLVALVRANSPENLRTEWKLEEGPAMVDMITPDSLNTDVLIKQQGIYRFSITCTEGKQSVSDQVTLRYTNKGEGRKLFIPGDHTKYDFEAEDFAFAYGEASIITDQELSKGSCLLLKAGKKGTAAMLEYSVGMAHDSDVSIWLLVKTPDSRHNILSLLFNDREFENLSLSKRKEWQWVKVPGNITASPGQWQFLITNIQGAFYMDKIIFSQDPEFIPEI